MFYKTKSETFYTMLATLNKISRDHNCCEDTVHVKETEEVITGGVFDGCSTGINSHWASQTIAYTFAQYATPTTCLSVRMAWRELQMIKLNLNLTPKHFESTCMIFRYHKPTKTLKLRIFGDGYYFINGVEYEVDQNNLVDYLGDHLNDTPEQFKQFLEKYPEIRYDNVTSFQICSDGIKRVERSQFAEKTEIEPMALLLHPPTSSNYLQRQWNILKNNHFYLTDDLSIISYVQD